MLAAHFPPDRWRRWRRVTENDREARRQGLSERHGWREDLFGKGTDLRLGSRNIGARWKPLEAIREVEVPVAVRKVAQDQEEGIASKLLGLVLKATAQSSSYIFNPLIRPSK